MTGTEGFRVRVARIDDAATKKALGEVRRDLQADLARSLLEAGTTTVLPEARRRAPRARGISASLTVRSARSARAATLTTTHRGKLGRLVGLLEFGGRVETFGLPTRARRRKRTGRRPAVMTPMGPRYIVRGPRQYRGKYFMTTAVAATIDQFAQAVADDAVAVFARHGIDADAAR